MKIDVMWIWIFFIVSCLVFQNLFTYIKYDYDVTYYIKTNNWATFKQIGLTVKPKELNQRDVRIWLLEQAKKNGEEIAEISIINLVKIDSTRYFGLPWK